MKTTHFDDKITIKCLKNEKMIEAEVLSFREKEFLTAVVQKTAKINMQWNPKKNLYIGRQVGLEFVTEGPEKFITDSGRG